MVEVIKQVKSSPFPEQYKDLPPISELLNRNTPLSPMKLREICNQYRMSGVDIHETERPEGVTVVTKEGKIRSRVPHIRPFGNDVTVVHELLHVEQILRAKEKGVTVDDLQKQSPNSLPIAEIAAREAEIEYINRLPFFTRIKAIEKEKRRRKNQ